MLKPVTRITYDMEDFLDSCIDLYCELAQVDRKTLKQAVTLFPRTLHSEAARR